MEITPWTIYWITRLDSLAAIFLALLIIASVTTAFLAVDVSINRSVYGEYAGQPDDHYGKIKLNSAKSSARLARRIFAPLALASGLAFALTPSTKEACAIVAIPAIANGEATHEIAGDIVTLAREWLEELRPKGKE